MEEQPTALVQGARTSHHVADDGIPLARRARFSIDTQPLRRTRGDRYVPPIDYQSDKSRHLRTPPGFELHEISRWGGTGKPPRVDRRKHLRSRPVRQTAVLCPWQTAVISRGLR